MLHHFSHVIEYWILLGLSIFFSHSISKSFHADECTFLSEEKASTSFFIARISPWWTTDVLLAKECREHFTQIMICYDIIIDDINVMYSDIVVLLYIVSDALRYGYVVAVFCKKQKPGPKISDLFASPLPCRSRWSSSRLSLASWKNPTVSGQMTWKTEKKTWIQGKTRQAARSDLKTDYCLNCFCALSLSTTVNLWHCRGRNPWLTHQISSHFVGFQTGLGPGSKPSWEISLRIVSEDL